MNAKDTAACSGARAGRARRSKDESLAQFETHWFRKWVNRQPADQQSELLSVWGESYRLEASPE